MEKGAHNMSHILYANADRTKTLYELSSSMSVECHQQVPKWLAANYVCTDKLLNTHIQVCSQESVGSPLLLHAVRFRSIAFYTG